MIVLTSLFNSKNLNPESLTLRESMKYIKYELNELSVRQQNLLYEKTVMTQFITKLFVNFNFRFNISLENVPKDVFFVQWQSTPNKDVLFAQSQSPPDLDILKGLHCQQTQLMKTRGKWISFGDVNLLVTEVQFQEFSSKKLEWKLSTPQNEEICVLYMCIYIHTYI